MALNKNLEIEYDVEVDLDWKMTVFENKYRRMRTFHNDDFVYNVNTEEENFIVCRNF